MYIEPTEYFTESMRKILEEGETARTVLFEHLSRGCLDSIDKELEGFMILDDGSFYETKYKPKPEVNGLFSELDPKKLDEKNYKKKLLFTSKELAETINHFTEIHKAEINALPKSISNTFVLDGNEDFVRIGDKSIAGHNIFYEAPYKINDEEYKKFDSERQKNENGLELLTTLYAEIKNIVDKNEGDA
jgi:hypothetical protein